MNTEGLQGVLRKHLAIDQEEAAHVAQWFLYKVETRIPVIYDGKTDPEELRKIVDALAVLEKAFSKKKMTDAAMTTFKIMTFNEGAAHDDLELKYQGHRAWGAVFDFLPHIKLLMSGAGKAAREIEEQGFKAKCEINRDRTPLVVTHFAVDHWVGYGMRKPGSFNDDTPFGRFLTDLFEVFQIERSPRATFNAWLKIDTEQQR